MHSLHTAGDALIAVSLAGTLFFSVPLDQARGRVALYLLTSMAPFAVVAPVIGPLLDRIRSGRRAALAATFLTRAAIAWLMAGVDGLELYPLAFAVLVTSKGYGVARSAAVPRLRPDHLSLVAANARLSTTGVLAAAVSAGVGAGVVAVAGSTWSLRLATVVLVCGAVLALRLPPAVNSPAAETPTADPASAASPTHIGLSDAARSAVVAAVSLRALSGYLTLFLAFLLRADGAGTTRLAVVVCAAAAGSMTGTLVGGVLRATPPELLLVAALGGAAVGCGVAAWSFSVTTAAVAAAASGAGGSLGKLALDSILQRDVPDDVRGQAFARSETALQLAWVAGGAVGIVLPLRGGLGLGLAALGMVVATTATWPALHRRRG